MQVFAVTRQMDQSDVIAAALAEYLERQGARRLDVWALGPAAGGRRGRPAPDPRAAEAFLAGRPLEEPAPPPAPAGGTKRTVIRRQDGRELVRTTVYLEPDLAKRLRVFAVKEDREQSEIMGAALAEYLARHGG